MATRGPDAEGVWEGEGIVLGHRRLAILDLDPRASQPMVWADGRYVIVFNGEIYNFRELRRELEVSGVGFRTTSDTEVLLALFHQERERMLPRLRGMFAFAIWDAQSRELFLARDPYGIKPIYYTQLKDGLLFASQVKALLASGAVSSKREPAGLAGFYLWGSVPEPWTLFRDVFALPAGHWLRVCAGVVGKPVSWHDIRSHWCREGGPESLATREQVRRAVRDSVRDHLVSDVPISVFLSAGIDSGVIARLAVELGAHVEGITVGFEEFVGHRENEVPVARVAAAHYSLTHRVRMVSRSEFLGDIPRILDAMDQPSIDGVNTWFASKAAAEAGYKVVLSGVGGDELFGGYSLFRQIPRQAALGKALASLPGVKSLLRGPCAALAALLSRPKLAGVPAFMDSVEGMYFLRRGLFLPGELPALMGLELAREGLTRLGGGPPGRESCHARDNVSALGMLESTHYLRNQLLRDSDWASMAHSLELRTPFVDARLLETLGPLTSRFAGGTGKAMLAQSPKLPLPAMVMSRAKTGFSLPMASWLRPARDSGRKFNSHQSPHRSHWARRWAAEVISNAIECA